MKTILCVAIAAISVMTSCKKKDVNPLPSGKNTFTCQIDGKEFSPKIPVTILSTSVALRAYRTDNKGGFVVQAQDPFNKLEFYLSTTQGAGTYTVGYARGAIPYAPNPDSYAAYTRYKPLSPGDDPYNTPLPPRFYTDAVNTGTMTLTRMDTVARIAGGTFEYTAREATTGKLVCVTNGKFDVTF